MLTVTQSTTKPFSVYFGISGLTVTATLSKNGGAFNSVSPTYADRGNGYYTVMPIAAHRDTLGENAWLFSASGQTSVPRVEQVVAANVDAVAYGANTTTPPTVSDIANAVWAAGTRTLTSFGTLASDIATAVWGAGTRTLTAISDSAGVSTLLLRITGVLRTKSEDETAESDQTAALEEAIGNVSVDLTPVEQRLDAVEAKLPPRRKAR